MLFPIYPIYQGRRRFISNPFQANLFLLIISFAFASISLWFVQIGVKRDDDANETKKGDSTMLRSIQRSTCLIPYPSVWISSCSRVPGWCDNSFPCALGLLRAWKNVIIFVVPSTTSWNHKPFCWKLSICTKITWCML